MCSPAGTIKDDPAVSSLSSFNSKITLNCDRIIEFGIYLHVFALFNQGTTALTRISIYIPLLAWLLKHALTRMQGLGYLQHPIAASGLVFFGLVFVSTLQAPDILISMDNYRKNIGQALFLLLLIPDVFRQPQRIQRLLLVTLGSGIYINLLHFHKMWQIYQSSGIWQFFPLDATYYRDYANALVFFIPFTLYWALQNKGKQAIALSALLLLQLLLLGSTGARGAWLGAGAALLFWLAFSFNRRLLIIGLLSTLIVVFAGLSGDNVISQRISLGWNSSNRIDMIWLPTLQLVAERPLTGYGFGNQIFIDALKLATPDSPVLALGPLLSTHSNYLQIAFASGIVALLAMLVLYGQIIRQTILKIRAPGSADRLCLLAATSAFVGTMLVRGLVENMRWAPFGVLLGMILAIILIQPDKSPGHDP